MKKRKPFCFRSACNRQVGILAILGLAGFICFSSQCSKNEEKPLMKKTPEIIPKKVVGLGRVEPEMRIVSLSSEVPGIISLILVQPGEKVGKGDGIVQLSDRIEQARIELAKSQILVQESQVVSAKAMLETTRARLLSTKNNYLRLKKLVESEAKPRSSFEQAQAEYDSLVADIKRLESNVSTARIKLIQLQAELHLAQAQLVQKTIAAPANGLLLSIDIPAGSHISPGETVGSFAPESGLTVWCEIDELFADQIKTGQKAFIRLPGRSKNQGEGIVSFAGPWLRKKSIFSDDIGDLEDRRVREVRIRLNPGTDILLGSRVECVITLDR